MSALADVFGYAAASFTTLSFVPQVVRVVRTRDTQAISKTAYVVFCLGVALWLAYGLIAGNAPVVLANGVTLVLASIVLGYKLRLG